MRIKQINIKSFRGIPNNLIIPIQRKNNRPTSLLILGDNGVGKSSIVDAIEFCLQAHISQTQVLSGKTIPSVRSFYNSDLPEVSILLENDELVYRTLIVDEQGLLFNVKYPHNLYSISPFVLRRHDLLRFIDSSEAERTLVFSNYLKQKSDGIWIEHPIDELKRLQDERLIIKNKRDDLIKNLANTLDISIDKIPFDRKLFKDFVKDYIYKGIIKSQFESKGFKVKLNEKAIALAEEAELAIEEHRKIKRQISAFSISESIKTFPKHLLHQLDEFIFKVSDKLTKSFLEITPSKFIKRIEIKYEHQSVLALSLILVLNNNAKCNPNQILSEANLDLLALLFFLAFIQESTERGQAKFLILDDVLQSVDSTIRVSFITYLLKNYPDWQYVITSHDRLWHRQLNELMNLCGHQYQSISLVEWSYENGPKVSPIATSIDESLFQVIGNNDLVSICSNSGLLLEQICDGISKSLNTTIQRKNGDKYTLGDLWPGIVKVLKKTILKEEVESVEKWLHLRNLIGAHYNEWALSLSLEESRSFGQSVITLYKLVKCDKCFGWILNNSDFAFYSCKCGTLLINKK